MAATPTVEVLKQMERFVVLIVAGGCSLVVGLWVVGLFEAQVLAWWVGVALIGLGIAGVGGGIATQVDADL